MRRMYYDDSFRTTIPANELIESYQTLAITKRDYKNSYINKLPPSQRRHPAVMMLQDILDEACASGYPERIELVNRASSIIAEARTATRGS